MKTLQFQVTDTSGVMHTINSQTPLTFEYANVILKEMGIDRNVKKITYIGSFNYSFD